MSAQEAVQLQKEQAASRGGSSEEAMCAHGAARGGRITVAGATVDGEAAAQSGFRRLPVDGEGGRPSEAKAMAASSAPVRSSAEKVNAAHMARSRWPGTAHLSAQRKVGRWPRCPPPYRRRCIRHTFALHLAPARQRCQHVVILTVRGMLARQCLAPAAGPRNCWCRSAPNAAVPEGFGKGAQGPSGKLSWLIANAGRCNGG